MKEIIPENGDLVVIHWNFPNRHRAEECYGVREWDNNWKKLIETSFHMTLVSIILKKEDRLLFERENKLDIRS